MQTEEWMRVHLRCGCRIKAYSVQVFGELTLVECNQCDAVWEMGAERKPEPTMSLFAFMTAFYAYLSSNAANGAWLSVRP